MPKEVPSVYDKAEFDIWFALWFTGQVISLATGHQSEMEWISDSCVVSTKDICSPEADVSSHFYIE